MMRTPSHSTTDQSAYIIASGVTEADRNVSIGASPASDAAASCSSGSRPKTSPARSQTAVTVTSSQSSETIRSARSRSNTSPPLASQVGGRLDEVVERWVAGGRVAGRRRRVRAPLGSAASRARQRS